MKTVYKFTVSKPTPCPFSGLHHADGQLLVLERASLSFFAPADDGTPGRMLTDPRPLKSDADREYVGSWLAAAVKAGTLVEVKAPVDEPAKTEPAPEPVKTDPKPTK